MTLPVPPLTLLKYARVLYYLSQFGSITRPHLFDYWLGLASSGELTWARFSVKCEDTVSTEVADDMYFKLDVVNYTGGRIDTSWNSTDLDTVASQIDSRICQPWTAYMSNNSRFTQVSAYIMNFNEPPPAGVDDPLHYKHFLDSGPPVKTWPLSRAGTGVGYQGPQMAASVTMMTPVRAHWGRFYLPRPAGERVLNSGHLDSSVVVAMAGQVDAMFADLAGAEFFPVVPSTQDNKQVLYSLQNISGVRMDDVLDVIRRRRLKHALTKVTHDAETPFMGNLLPDEAV